MIVGPRAHRFSNLLARSRFYPKFRDPQPRIQCVHEDDVAAAIVAALFSDARGAFNLAPADSISVREARRLLHRVPLALPLPATRTLIRGIRGLLGIGPETAWVQTLRYNLVLHSQRARRELGWNPRYDSVQDCLKALSPARG